MDFNYEEIIEQITPESIIELMTKLGADRYEETENAIIFPTICHNIDSAEASMKLYYYKNTHLLYCYTEDGAMSIFKFLKIYYETRDIEYDWYEDIYQVVLNCSNLKQVDGFVTPKYKSIRDKYSYSQLQSLPEFNKDVLDCFTHYYAVEWLNDGITKSAMDKYNILFSISQNKIIIPHYDVNNRLIGIRGRALDEWEVENIGKYAPVKVEQTWYRHPLSLNLYGLNINKENIKKSGICFICEAEKSVLQADSFSSPNCCVAICGSNFNKYALKILLKECSPQEIVLCLDNEEKPGEEKYFNKLYSICEKYQKYCNFYFVYDRSNINKYKDSATDCGEEIFKELVSRRIRVK